MSSVPPPEGRTLWMGAIQPYWDEAFIAALYQSTAQVQNVRIIRHANPMALGYAFIEFSTHSAAREILEAYHGKLIPGTSIAFRLNWGRGGTTSAPKPSSEGASLFVGDLAPEVTNDMLFAEFSSRYSSCSSAKVITDTTTGQSKGYGFVKFSNEAECQRALEEMNGARIGSRIIRTGHAQSRAAMNAGQKAFMNANLQNPYVYPASLGAYMQLYANMGLPTMGGIGPAPIPQVLPYAPALPRPVVPSQWPAMYQPGMMVPPQNPVMIPPMPPSPVHSFQGYESNGNGSSVQTPQNIQASSMDQTQRTAKPPITPRDADNDGFKHNGSAAGKTSLEQPLNEQPEDQQLGAENALNQEDTLEESFNVDVSNQAYVKLHSHNGVNGFSHTSTENNVDLDSVVSDSEEHINEAHK